MSEWCGYQTLYVAVASEAVMTAEVREQGVGIFAFNLQCPLMACTRRQQVVFRMEAVREEAL
jgi:hypothetical protein